MGPWVFLASFLLYVFSAYPTVAAQDAGELILGPVGLGIVHPPGYPLYSLLGHLWSSLLPFGNLAFRINLFSAGMTALAVWGVFRLLRRTSGPWLAAAVALAVGSVTHIWDGAVTSEVYALNLVLCSFLLTKVFNSAEYRVQSAESKPSSLPTLSCTLCTLHLLFLWGISLGNHHLLLLWGPVIAWLAVKELWGRWRLMAAGGLLVGLGLVLYLYLPFRSFAQPLIDWGHPADGPGRRRWPCTTSNVHDMFFFT